LTPGSVRDYLPFVLAYEGVLDAVADRTRREILEQLTRGPLAVSELADGLPVSRPAVSQHLRVLRDAGLVRFEPQGTRNVYRLDRTGFDTLRAWVDSFWDDVLGAFEAYADQPTTPEGGPR
jgi:DNA-binding transcriptional ArsR family regulator